MGSTHGAHQFEIGSLSVKISHANDAKKQNDLITLGWAKTLPQ